jgi:predicted metal-binding membrane protein
MDGELKQAHFVRLGWSMMPDRSATFVQMTNSTLEAVLRRDRLVVAGAVGAVVALAWGYVLWLAADMDMGGMDMAGFRMNPAGIGIMAPANAPWRAVEFAFVFAMWAVMMGGMMAPSAAPMILMYARVGRQGKAAGKPLAATGWFTILQHRAT